MTIVSRFGRAGRGGGPKWAAGAGIAEVWGVVSPLVPLIALALLAAGCLFIEEVNHPPTAALHIKSGAPDPGSPEQPVALAARCIPLELDASASLDPDEGKGGLQYQWRLYRRSGEGTLMEAAPEDAELQADGDHARVGWNRAGAWAAEVTVTDGRGAASPPARLEFLVADAPPRAQIIADRGPSGCGDYAAGARLGFAALDEDIDADAMCAPSETLTFAWRATAPMAAAMAGLAAGPCGQRPAVGMLSVAADAMAPENTRRVCLWTDTPGTYEIELTTDDGAGRPPAEVAKNGQTARITLTVAGDRPPCMDGFRPAPGKTYSLGRDAEVIFEVTEILDDLDPYPGDGASFRWSLWHELDPVWRPVAGFHEAAIALDPTAYAIDELLRVRVEPVDRVARDTSLCDPAQLLCDYAQAWPNESFCYQGSTCRAVATWEARFR
jgi:hypothetical protein